MKVKYSVFCPVIYGEEDRTSGFSLILLKNFFTCRVRISFIIMDLLVIMDSFLTVYVTSSLSPQPSIYLPYGHRRLKSESVLL